MGQAAGARQQRGSGIRTTSPPDDGDGEEIRRIKKGKDDPPGLATPQSSAGLPYEPQTSFTNDSLPSIDAYIGSKAGRRERKAEKKVVARMVTKMDAGHVLHRHDVFSTAASARIPALILPSSLSSMRSVRDSQ